MTHYDIRLITRRPPFPMRVMLDGVEAKFAVAADDENGWVEVLVTDETDSVLLFGRGKNKHTKTKVLHGTVAFEIIEKDDAE